MSSAGNNSNPTTDPSRYPPVKGDPILTPRKLKVVCIGAGFSGLVLSHKYNHLGNYKDYFDLTIYEKNHDVGGTWLENRYPGVACDVPAHIYTFTFEPNPEWSSFYAPGPEIWEYMKRTTVKYGLDRQIQFNSNLIESVWDNKAAKWKLKVNQNGKITEDEADIFVNSSGILNNWRWPKIENLELYQGKLVHTARWDKNLSWDGKRVAIIGNGSSAIQLLPEMQKTAAHIATYIRSPTWITSNYIAHLTKDGGNFKYSDEEIHEFKQNPQKLRAYRKHIEHEFNKFFYVLIRESADQKGVFETFTGAMASKLNNDPLLCKKLIPKWDVGCRRLTPGDGYLEALQTNNVDIDFNNILRFTKKGIETQDGEKEFDIIVCATGFDVSFKPRWQMLGRGGISLAEQWNTVPEAYMSICAPNMPNCFIFNGPNCPIGHGSLMGVLDWTSNYVLKWIRKISTENIKSVTVKPDVVREFNDYSQAFLKTTVWAAGCRSWYKNDAADGPVTAMYAGSVIHYKEFLERFRVEDFEIDYWTPNRFQFMGNGMTRKEIEGDDLGFYVNK